MQNFQLLIDTMITIFKIFNLFTYLAKNELFSNLTLPNNHVQLVSLTLS